MIVATIVLITLFFCGALYAYRVTFFSPRKNREKLPSTDSPVYDPYRPQMKQLFCQLMDRPFEIVTIQSHDGLLLSGRYYHVKDGAPLDIAFHGYRSSPLTDFSGGADLSFRLGHNLLLVDQRAHGKSQGNTITFGLQERHDLLRWVKYAIDRFGEDQKIVLYGISMGGGTVLMGAGMELPDNVKGIIADCPYASPLDIILYVGKTMPIPQWLIKPFVILGARIFGGFDLLETDAVREVRKAKVPILVIHGDADTFVPEGMSTPLIAANPDYVQRFTVTGAEHGISYLVNTQEYCDHIVAFMNKIL